MRITAASRAQMVAAIQHLTERITSVLHDSCCATQPKVYGYGYGYGWVVSVLGVQYVDCEMRSTFVSVYCHLGTVFVWGLYK